MNFCANSGILFPNTKTERAFLNDMMNMEFKRKLTIPAELKKEYPVTEQMRKAFLARDGELKQILAGEDDRIVLIIGPCSADREDSVLDYVNRLRELQEQTNMDEAAKKERKKRIRELANFIDSQPRTITEFDEALAKKLLEGVRVGETYLEFQFKSGARIVIENE